MIEAERDMEVYASDPLARFLDRRYLQVWAVHRLTGERVFLDRGQATDEMRRHTRANLMCPVPGCEVEISARGRSKRDHFFHLNPSGHGEGEGEWHLQAKALLADWANRQPGFTAREEEDVTIAGAERVRRADVMATGIHGSKVALEVEYKDYRPEHWHAKQSDYDDAEVTCTWVFGHLPRYLRQPRKPHGWPEHLTWDRLQWVELTEAVARAGRPVVFINPVERAVVTAVQQQLSVEDVREDRGWWRYADRVGMRLAHPDYSTEPVLVLDPLDQCILDQSRGLLTPTMVRVEAERAVIAAQAAAAKVSEEAYLRAEAERRARAAADRANLEREREERRLYAIRKAEEERQAWEQSPLRAALLTHFNGALPAFLTDELRHDRGVWGHSVHWHSRLFVDLVFDGSRHPKIGREVSMKQVYGMIKGAGFRLHLTNARLRGAAVRDFLERLDDRGVIDLDIDPTGMVVNIRVRSDGRVQQERPKPPKPTATIRVAASRPPQHSEPSRPAPNRPPSTPPVNAAPSTPRPGRIGPGVPWDESMMKKTILREFRGRIPDVLQGEDRPEVAHCIRVIPVHWHAYMYMKHIHQRAHGYTFTLTEACRTLVEHHLADAEDPNVEKAVIAYLDRLSVKHRALVQPDPTSEERRYTVTGALMTYR